MIALTSGGRGYEATAEVLVRPNAVDATFFQNDTRSLLDTEAAVVGSSEILTAAAKTVPGIDPAGLATSLAVVPDARHSTLRISLLADDPDLARTLTNSVASAYLTSVESRPDAVGRSSVTVLHASSRGLEAHRPNVLLYVLVGGLLGCLIASIASVVWKLLDPRLLDPDGLELTTGRPLVGKIPRSDLDPGRLVMIAQPESAAADAYRTLVSTIPFFALEEGVRCVAVTGSSPIDVDETSEVHTDIAINLAIACAHSGIRTMLVSGDLRHRAILARQLEPESPGLTDLILARAPWRELPTWQSKAGEQIATGDVVYMTSIDGLTFVPTGRTAPNPGDVLSSRAAGIALGHLKHLCDLIILDTPNYANPETANIVRYAEAVIAVVSRGLTRKAALRILTASTQLQGVPLYFVLTERDTARRRSRTSRSLRTIESTAGTPTKLTTPATVTSNASPSRPSPTTPVWSTPTQMTPAAAEASSASRSAPSWAATPPPPPPPPPRSAPPPPPAPAPSPAPAPTPQTQAPAPAPSASPSSLPPTVRPSALPERPTLHERPGRSGVGNPNPEPISGSTTTTAVRKAPAQTRANAWRQARLAAKRTERAVRKQIRDEIERKKAPPRGKQY